MALPVRLPPPLARHDDPHRLGGDPSDGGGGMTASDLEPVAVEASGGSRSAAIATTLVGTFGTQALVMVGGILAARILGVEDRGHQALFVVLTAALGQILSMGLPVALTYSIARQPDSSRALLRLTVPLIATQAIAGLLLNMVAVLAVTAGSETRVRDAGLIGALIVPFYIGNGVILGVLQGLRLFRSLTVFRLLTPAAYSFSLLAAYLLAEGSLLAVMALWAAATGVSFLVGCLLLRRALGPGSVRPLEERRSLLSFGLKAMLGSVSPLEAFRLDQGVVGLFLSPTALGLYTSGVAFTNLPRLGAQAVGLVGLPHVASQRDPRLQRRAVVQFSGIGTALALAICAVVFVLAPWLVPFLFGAAFAPAAELTRILIFSAAFAGTRRVISDAVTGAGLPAIGSQGELLSWVTLTGALALLLPPYGAKGVAWALVMSSFIALVYSILRAWRLLRSAHQPTAEGVP